MPLQSLLLADSTAFGWLPAGPMRQRGSGTVMREGGLVACISCGASLVKRGGSGLSILCLVKEAALQAHPDFAQVPPDTRVCVRAVRAERSVPNREYEALAIGRKDWSVLEAGPCIMDVCAQRYGTGKKPLHFLEREAEGAMTEVWQAAVQGFPSRSEQTVDILLCCGWNCEASLLPVENFAAGQLIRCETWKDFTREALTQAGGTESSR